MTLAARVLNSRPDLGALPSPLNDLVRQATDPDPTRRPTAQALPDRPGRRRPPDDLAPHPGDDEAGAPVPVDQLNRTLTGEPSHHPTHRARRPMRTGLPNRRRTGVGFEKIDRTRTFATADEASGSADHVPTAPPPPASVDETPDSSERVNRAVSLGRYRQAGQAHLC